MGRPPSLAAAIFGVAVSWTSLSVAERVVLVRPPPADAMLVDAWHRLQAELRIHDFVAVVAPPNDGEATSATLSRAAERASAFAAMALVRHPSSASVDVWLVDRASGKTTMRTIEVEDGADASSILAIRAVDLLRASLREFPAGAGPPRDVVGVDRSVTSDAIARFTARPEPSVHVSAEAVMLVERGLGVAAGPALGLWFRLVDCLEIGVAAAGPLLGARLDTALGSASTHQEEAVGELRFRIVRASFASVDVHASAGAHFLTAEGAPRAPLRPRTESVVAFLAGAGADLIVPFSQTLAAHLGVSAMATAPRLGVAVDQATSAIDAPIVAVSAGLRVGL